MSVAVVDCCCYSPPSFPDVLADVISPTTPRNETPWSPLNNGLGEGYHSILTSFPVPPLILLCFSSSLCSFVPLFLRYLVEDWDGIEKLWAAAADHMRINLAQHPVVVAEHALATRKEREKHVEVVFEKFGSPGAFLSREGVLAW